MLLERLDQAILAVFDNPKKIQQTSAIGTLFWQTLSRKHFWVLKKKKTRLTRYALIAIFMHKGDRS